MNNKYEDFWKWFEKNSELIFNFENNVKSIFELLNNNLYKIDENLVFEISSVENNKREFIISADGIIDSFCEVENLFEHKPELEKWTIIKYRQRKKNNEINMDGIKLSVEDMYFNLFNDGSKVGILVFIKDYDEELHGELVFTLLDMALGEYDMETKVGGIEFLDFNSEYFKNALPFKTLQENFDNIYQKINK